MVEVRDLERDFRLGLDRVAFAKEELGITPDPWQEKFLRSEADKVLLNCSRQAGKSTLTAIVGLHRALYHDGSLILMLAPSERQAKEIFSKLASLYPKLGHPVPSDSHRRMGLEQRNGSRVEALPGTEKTVRGFSSVDLLILDEAARVADELYDAVRPMLAVSGGRLIMLSSPWGRRGVFYREWTEGSSWERYRVTAHEVPRISEEFLADERRSLGQWRYDQEYMAIFGENSNALFRYQDIEAAVTDSFEPLFGSSASGARGAA